LLSRLDSIDSIQQQTSGSKSHTVEREKDIIFTNMRVQQIQLLQLLVLDPDVLRVVLISHQPAVLFSHIKPVTSNQPAVLFSQNKPAPAINHHPTEQAVSC
jgi:phage gp46-like protein